MSDWWGRWTENPDEWEITAGMTCIILFFSFFPILSFGTSKAVRKNCVEHSHTCTHKHCFFFCRLYKYYSVCRWLLPTWVAFNRLVLFLSLCEDALQVELNPKTLKVGIQITVQYFAARFTVWLCLWFNIWFGFQTFWITNATLTFCPSERDAAWLAWLMVGWAEWHTGI